MKTAFSTKQIKGKGRGKFLGYPTINMEIPPAMDLADGIYAAWVTIGGTKFMGALHYGPIPTFDDEAKSLEVFLLGVTTHDLRGSDTSLITIELVSKLREVIKFASIDELTRQMSQDVSSVHKILSESTH